MKRLTLILITILSCQHIIAQTKKELKIIANIANLPDSTKFFLVKSAIENYDTAATAISKNGRIEIRESLYSEGAIYFLKLDTTKIKIPKSDRSWIRILTDNQDIMIDGNLSDWPIATVKGNKANDAYTQMSKDILNIEKHFSINLQDNDTAINGKARRDQSDSLILLFDRNKNEYATPLYAYKMYDYFTYPQMELIYNRLTPRVKTSYSGLLFKNTLRIIAENKKVQPGYIIPTFNVKNEAGETIPFQNTYSKQKITLIDFWASWCIPCRNAFPILKELYSKYDNAGFNIVSVSIDKQEYKWRKALSEENLPWYQTNTIDNTIIDLLSIKTIPALVLIDQNGRIIAYNSVGGRIEPFGPSLQKKDLEQTIKNVLQLN